MFVRLAALLTMISCTFVGGPALAQQPPQSSGFTHQGVARDATRYETLVKALPPAQLQGKRANEVKASFGSFNQARVVGIAAPRGFDDQTFAAFSLRKSDGFGARRASQSGTMNAQYGLDLGSDSHLRLLATAYGARSQLPGVLRQLSSCSLGNQAFEDVAPDSGAAQCNPFNAAHAVCQSHPAGVLDLQ